MATSVVTQYELGRGEVVLKGIFKTPASRKIIKISKFDLTQKSMTKMHTQSHVDRSDNVESTPRKNLIITTTHPTLLLIQSFVAFYEW
jgi:hypothetical protein